jgi:peptidyl-prolyl isomerase G (cyclophilin G)
MAVKADSQALPSNSDNGRPEKRSRRSRLPDDARRHRKKPKQNEDTNLEKMVVGETEEEYDARLEKEEFERVRIRQRKNWERISQNVSDGLPATIRFKGGPHQTFAGPCQSSFRRSWANEIH